MGELAPLNSRIEKETNNVISYLPEEICLVSSRGHKRTFVAAREQGMIRADTAIRREIEERIIITMILTLSTRPALVRLVACAFNWGDVDLDDAVEKFARGALDCSSNSPAVSLPGILRTEFCFLLSGVYSRADFHSQFLSGVGDGDRHCSCSVC